MSNELWPAIAIAALLAGYFMGYLGRKFDREKDQLPPYTKQKPPTQPVWTDWTTTERERRLVAALRDADLGIQAGQACRSEGEFNRWMRDVQRYRPHTDLIT